METRVQKLLSDWGVLSRRAAERAMAEGRVTVNGERVLPGQKADPERDVIALDGQPLGAHPDRVCLMLNKPRGYVTTMNDEQGRPDVSGLVADCGTRVYPVGRLDLNSEGLLLMTNDGALAQRLTHPSHEVEKEYLVRTTGDVGAALPVLSQEMTVDGVRYRPAKTRLIRSDDTGSLLSVIIREGKNRQVRKMCAAAGLRVVRLRRVREGPLELGDLPSGRWRWLTAAELKNLKEL